MKKEGRKKRARSNKQLDKTTPTPGSYFSTEKSYLGVGLKPDVYHLFCLVFFSLLSTCACMYIVCTVYTPGWKGAREYAQFRGISAVFRVIARQSRVFFSRVFAFSRPNTVRTRVISPIDGRETARKRSDNINTFYVLFAPAREFIRETA